MVEMCMRHNDCPWLAAITKKITYKFIYFISSCLQTGVNHYPACCIAVLYYIHVHKNVLESPHAGSNQPCMFANASFFCSRLLTTVNKSLIHDFLFRGMETNCIPKD